MPRSLLSTELPREIIDSLTRDMQQLINSRRQAKSKSDKPQPAGATKVLIRRGVSVINWPLSLPHHMTDGLRSGFQKPPRSHLEQSG